MSIFFKRTQCSPAACASISSWTHPLHKHSWVTNRNLYWAAIKSPVYYLLSLVLVVLLSLLALIVVSFLQVSVIWSPVVHVFRISALNDKDMSLKLVLPCSILQIIQLFEQSWAPQSVIRAHRGAEPSPRDGTSPLHHFPSTFGLHPLQMLLFPWDLCTILFHIFAAVFHPRCSWLLYTFHYCSLLYY